MDDKRQFDVRANGVTVVDDLDLFDVTDEAFEAYDVEVPVTVGADGVLTLEFDGTASDNAKGQRHLAARGGGRDGPDRLDRGRAPAVAEVGDDGSATLAFPLTASDAFTGTITVSFTVDGAASSQSVAFADGVGVLSVEVADDDLASDAATAVVLTGVDSGSLGAATSASGTVAEDDAAPAVDQGVAPQGATVGAAFAYAVPADAFADADSTLSLSATLADGSPLPAWLSFDGTGFSGTPGAATRAPCRCW